VNGWSRCPACGTKVKSSDTSCPTCEAALSAAATQPGDESPGTSSLFKKDKIAAELKDALAPGIQVLRRFGAGAMSTLYLGRDPALRRLVAIKVLSKDLAKDAVARARFTREAESAAAVSHPHVVGIYQVGKLPQSNVPYIVMQFVDGKTLQQELLSDRVMPEARAKRIVGEVASALANAHERGLVHRDIKPANILMDREGGRAVVLDFGITAALDRTSLAGSEKLTIQGMAVGTPIYMSPEQAAAKEVTDRSDVYSLGAVAFELVTGRPPFKAESPEGYIAAHVGEQPPDLGELRPDLDPQFAPERRPTAAEASRALLSSTHPPVEWPPPGLEQIRGRGWTTLVSLGVAAGLSLFFFAMLLFGPNLGAPAGGGTTESAPVWFFFLRTALTATVLVGLVTLVLGGRLAYLLKGARSAGYPWPVVVPVALDPRPDAAALLNGYGVFALLGDANRDWLIRFRRYRGWALGVTVALAIACPLLWSVMLHSGTAGGATGLVTGFDAVVLLLPAALGVLVTVLLGIPETVVRSRARKWPRFFWPRRRRTLGVGYRHRSRCCRNVLRAAFAVRFGQHAQRRSDGGKVA
jgi:tRNA A-37 threonylcarbamoyl transferase component Bud32